jgi:hypothetical protein
LYATAEDLAGLIRADYIYQVRASGYDVNAVFGTNSPFPWENEIAVPGPIPASAIESAWGPEGWLLNPGVRTMTWDEVTVPGVRAGEPVTSRIRFTAGDVCMVEVTVGDDLDVRGQGPDLFEALRRYAVI